MVGYIVQYMETPISLSTDMVAAFGRLHNSGVGAFGARSTVVESIVVDDEIGDSINSTIYPFMPGSQNGAATANPSGRIVNCSGQILEKL